MPLQDMLILITPAQTLFKARETGLNLGYAAYRVGRGPHLFRDRGPAPPRGAYMVIDSRGFDGWGEPGSFCQEVVRECAARGLRGVICDFPGRPMSLLERVVVQLEENLSRRSMPLIVPEGYGGCTRRAGVAISSALSGGSWRTRLEEAGEQFGGMERVVVQVERVAEDFFLPSPTGSGRAMSQEELRECLEQRAPSVFFSGDLCARYFTYRSKDNGVHFILYDDAGSIAKKLQTAWELGSRRALAGYGEVGNWLPQLLGRGAR